MPSARPSVLLAVALALFARPAAAERPLPRSARVVDETGSVDAVSAEAIARIAAAAKEQGGPNLAVLVVPSPGGEPLDRFASRVYVAWHLGTRDRDDGILLVYAAEQGLAVVQPGAALEAAIGGDRLSPALQSVLPPRTGAALGPALVEAARLTLLAAGSPPDAVAEPYRIRTSWGALAVALGISFSVLFRVAWVTTLALADGWAARRRRRAGLPPQPEPAPAPPRAPIVLSLREHGALLVVESRMGRPTPLVALVLVFALPAFALFWNRGVDELVCSRAAGACYASRAGEIIAFQPLRRVRRFETWRAHKQPTVLVAVTPAGNAVLASGWPDETLEEHSRELNALLAGAAVEERRFSHDRGPTLGDVSIVAAFCALPLLLVWAFVSSCVVTLDRRRGVASRRRLLSRSRRPLSDFAGVTVWTTLDRELEKLRRAGRPRPYATPNGSVGRVVLVAPDGQRWAVTRWSDPGVSADLVGAARAVADFLHLPFVPSPKAPSPGTVPPPLPPWPWERSPAAGDEPR